MHLLDALLSSHSLKCCATDHDGHAVELVQQESQIAFLVLGRKEHVLLSECFHSRVLGRNLNLHMDIKKGDADCLCIALTGCVSAALFNLCTLAVIVAE